MTFVRSTDDSAREPGRKRISKRLVFSLPVRTFSGGGGSSTAGAAKRSESEQASFSTCVSVRACASHTARRAKTLRVPFSAPRPAAR
jgi:hypothetical protein